MAAAITIQCPNLTCRAVLQVPEKVRGKKIRCGKCDLCFMVPAPRTAKAPPQPAAAAEKK